MINTIVGGFAEGDSSNNAKKKHLRTVHQVNYVATAKDATYWATS